jgi:hypothetical protein
MTSSINNTPANVDPSAVVPPSGDDTVPFAQFQKTQDLNNALKGMNTQDPATMKAAVGTALFKGMLPPWIQAMVSAYSAQQSLNGTKGALGEWVADQQKDAAALQGFSKAVDDLGDMADLKDYFKTLKAHGDDKWIAVEEGNIENEIFAFQPDDYSKQVTDSENEAEYQVLDSRADKLGGRGDSIQGLLKTISTGANDMISAVGSLGDALNKVDADQVRQGS